MFSIIVGVFVVLHGLVHLLYFAQSRRLFELSPGLRWPDGSWAFTRLVGDETTSRLTSTAYALAAAVFGIGLLIDLAMLLALLIPR